MNKQAFDKKLNEEIEKNRGARKRLLTLKAVRNELRPLGMQIAKIDDELRVKHVGQPWSKAYFTNDLTDALETGKKISAEIATERERIKASSKMQTGHLLVEAATAASRKPTDEHLMQQIQERDARQRRTHEAAARVNEVASTEKSQRSNNFGIALGGTIVMLSEADIDDSEVLAAMIDSTDPAYKDAALRMSKILQKFSERIGTDKDPRQGEVVRWAEELEAEPDIERDRR